MWFSINHQRGAVGNDLTVAIKVEDGPDLCEVVVRYDQFDLVRERLDPPAKSYERTFPQQGGGAPGIDHKLVVTGTDASGNAETATSEWADEV